MLAYLIGVKQVLRASFPRLRSSSLFKNLKHCINYLVLFDLILIGCYKTIHLFYVAQLLSMMPYISSKFCVKCLHESQYVSQCNCSIIPTLWPWGQILMSRRHLVQDPATLALPFWQPTPVLTRVNQSSLGLMRHVPPRRNSLVISLAAGITFCICA